MKIYLKRFLFISTTRGDKKNVKSLSDDALTVHDLDGEEDNLSITQFPLYRNNSRHFITQTPVEKRGWHDTLPEL